MYVVDQSANVDPSGGANSGSVDADAYESNNEYGTGNWESQEFYFYEYGSSNQASGEHYDYPYCG